MSLLSVCCLSIYCVLLRIFLPKNIAPEYPQYHLSDRLSHGQNKRMFQPLFALTNTSFVSVSFRANLIVVRSVWFDKLKAHNDKRRIIARLYMLKYGHFGDHKQVSKDICLNCVSFLAPATGFITQSKRTPLSSCLLVGINPTKSEI